MARLARRRETDAPEPSHRIAVIAVAAQFFINGAIFASFMPRLPEIRDQVGLSKAGIGVVLSLAGATGLFGSALTGRAIERFGTRRVILIAGSIVALALAVVGQARAVPLLLAGLIGLSTFDVLVDTSMNLQGSWLSAARATPIMNRLHGLWSLGTALGGVVSARAAAAGVSLRVHLTVVAVGLLVVLLVISRGLLRHDHVAELAHGNGPPVAEPPSTSTSKRDLGLLLLFFAGVFGVSVEMTSIDWAAFRLTDDLRASTGAAALAYVAVTGGMTVGRFSGDWLTKRFGGDRLLIWSTVIAAVGLGVACSVEEALVVRIAYFFVGLGAATMMPRLYDRAAQRKGRRGAGLGSLTAGLRTAMLVVPALVGAVAESGSVARAVALVALPSALAFLLLVNALQRDHPVAR